jgi:hypothetical protein
MSGYNPSVEQTGLSEEARARAVLHGSINAGGSQSDSAYGTYCSQEKTTTNRSVGSVPRVREQVGGKMDSESLEEALDDIYDRRILFLGRFELYSQVRFHTFHT